MIKCWRYAIRAMNEGGDDAVYESKALTYTVARTHLEKYVRMGHRGFLLEIEENVIRHRQDLKDRALMRELHG